MWDANSNSWDEEDDEAAAAGPSAASLRAPTDPETLAEMGVSPMDIITILAMGKSLELRDRCDPLWLLDHPLIKEDPRRITKP